MLLLPQETLDRQVALLQKAVVFLPEVQSGTRRTPQRERSGKYDLQHAHPKVHSENDAEKEAERRGAVLHAVRDRGLRGQEEVNFQSPLDGRSAH